MHPAVAKNEYGDVTTSSPGPTPSAINAASRASVPEDTPMAWRTPSSEEISRSNASTSAPRMNCWLSHTRAIAARISSRIGANCAFRSSSGTDSAGGVTVVTT
jgi:hypothetical protein